MSVSDSSRSRFGDHRPRRSAVIASRRGRSAPGRPRSVSKYSARPSSSQSGRSPKAPRSSGVRRLVPQVFLQPGARVGIDVALRPLGQEERSPVRQLGEVELQEVVEVLAVVQDVDLDGHLLGRGADAQLAAGVALQRLEAADRGRILGHRRVREHHEGAGADLVSRRDQRLAAVEGRAAGPAQEQQDQRRRPPAGPSGRPFVRRVVHASPPVMTAAGRVGGSATAWPASPARSTARTPSSRSAARAPTADRGGGTAARRSGSLRGPTPG